MPEQDTNRRSSDRISAADLQRFLKGADYPADPSELKEVAESNDAPEEVMNFLERIPQREYGSPTQVSEELGKQE